MTMLALHHRLFEISGEFRERGSWRVELGAERRAARRGARLDARASSAMAGSGARWRGGRRRSAAASSPPTARPREAEPGVERVYPLAELDRMLPECDTVALCTALGPETTGLIDAHRLALMKPTAFLINIARGQVIDEDAVYAALRDRKIGGAALDVWWQYPTGADPQRRGSRHPFHELPNVIVTPHNSGWTAGMVRRRWDEIADNIGRFVRGDNLINVVTTT